MRRAIVFSDLHAHDYKQFNNNDRRLLNCLNIIDYVFSMAAKNGIDIILFPGDLFDQFGIMYTKVMNEVLATFQSNFNANPNIKFYAITGNHDQAGKSLFGKYCTSSLTTLETVFRDNFILLDNRPVDDGEIRFIGIPFYSTPEDFMEALKFVHEQDYIHPFNHNYLLMHQTVWPENSVVPQDVDYEHELFAPFSLIFNGHIHHFREYGANFINVGSPLHRDLGDTGLSKYIVIVDLDDAVYDIKDITKLSPQFRQIKSGESIPSEWESDFVVVEKEQLEINSEERFQEAQYSTSLSPQDLIRNYVREVSGSDEIYAAGVSLLNQVKQEE